MRSTGSRRALWLIAGCVIAAWLAGCLVSYRGFDVSQRYAAAQYVGWTWRGGVLRHHRSTVRDAPAGAYPPGWIRERVWAFDPAMDFTLLPGRGRGSGRWQGYDYSHTMGVQFTMFPIVLLTVAPTAAVTAPIVRQRRVVCTCGYDHRGLDVELCPECGLPIERF